MTDHASPPSSNAVTGTPPAGLTNPDFDERGLPAGRAINPDWEIGPRDVHRRVFGHHFGAKVRDGDSIPVLLDCRTAAEAQLARIDGDLHVPLHELHTKLESLRPFEETPIVVYCHTGNRSMQVTATLRELGFRDVRSMAGGIDLWSQSVDPAVPRY